MKIVEKKISPEYFEAVCKNTKNFELRKDEDNIQQGDLLFLREWDGDYTGPGIVKKVTYVLRNKPEHGLREGFCIIGMTDYWSTVEKDSEGIVKE